MIYDIYGYIYDVYGYIYDVYGTYILWGFLMKVEIHRKLNRICPGKNY